ncbi:MAG: ABC transporter permease [Anaerolineales bacterium]|nr:ABC transporter permease [Anaerolineales bacterium]
MKISTHRQKGTQIFQRLLLLGLIGGLLLPFIPLVIWSFSQRWYFPALLPAEWGLRAWQYVFAPGSRVLPAMLHSILVGLTVTGLSALIGIPAGRALGLHRFRGKRLVEFLILAPTIVPTLAAAMGIHVAFIRYGLADSLPGVILVHLIPVVPYMTLIMSSVFANYTVEYEEQARTLGASPRQVFKHVTWPAIWPGVLVGSLFAFVISWSQYTLTLIIGGGQVMTLPLLLFAFANSGDQPITAALSLVFMAPALLFLLLTARYLTGRNAALGGFGKL